MHLYPESLLITAAVLLPNLLFLVLPPLNVGAYGKPVDSVPFTILERVGQVLGIGHITISAREYLQLRRAPSR